MPFAPKENTNLTVTEAKARLSEVIERAQSSPQTITRNGKPSVVVVSAEEWQRNMKDFEGLGIELFDPWTA